MESDPLLDDVWTLLSMIRGRTTSFNEFKVTALQMFAKHGSLAFTTFYRGYNAFTQAVRLTSDERKLDFLLSCGPTHALPSRTVLLCLLAAIDDWHYNGDRMMRVLLRYHVPLNLFDNDRATPLSTAIKLHRSKAVQLLLDSGADMQCINDGSQRISSQEIPLRKDQAMLYRIVPTFLKRFLTKQVEVRPLRVGASDICQRNLSEHVKVTFTNSNR